MAWLRMPWRWWIRPALLLWFQLALLGTALWMRSYSVIGLIVGYTAITVWDIPKAYTLEKPDTLD